MGSRRLTRWITVVASVAAVGIGCSSSSVNEGSGGTAATGGAGGSSGAGGGAGTCTQKTAAGCVACCRTSDPDGYLEFVKTLKDFVCSSGCSKPCNAMCTEGDTTPSCADCVITAPLATSVLLEVKNNCAQYNDPMCVAWAACVETCMK